MWATLIPLSTFLAPLLGPLVLWLIFKDQFPNVDQAGRETLNFQISLMIYSLVFGILALALIGLPFLMLLPVFGFICTVLAAYHASRGRIYRYPACIRFL
ncbi:MAG: DUF4870 domain-containing protein [Planctomycetota bacterium]|nr:MAG: DUF4870 domain-containing protein [Planctomycetota bacterium]